MGMEKKCCRCKEVKPLTEFYKSKSKKDGYYSHCKLCQNAHAKNHYENNKQYYKEKAVRWRDQFGSQTAYRYKLNKETWQELYDKHNGLCHICKEKAATHIDHDHACCNTNSKSTCGKCTRGILCGSCNTMLGLARDNKETLENAIQYLGPRN